ncbi:MAG: HDOD domain-containing protein [Desulforhabdus sp.]|jgi:HD-like signal output (HDOD) protein|nr:HDOD domain-containing protein [Desulforhabdus sp.]
MMNNGSALDQVEIYQFAQIEDPPPLPQALQHLIEIIRDEIASARELESILRYDQSLSARVLRIANSAFYGQRSQVTTLSRAITIIGYYRVRAICLSSLLIEFFSSPTSLDALQKESLWKHAFATARIASEIADKRPWISREQAYILGLLHDLGRVIMAVHFSRHFRAIQNMAKSWKVPMWWAENHYGLTHTQTGKWAAVKWAFPMLFQEIMEFHHRPNTAPSNAPEVKMINLADVLAHSREYPQSVNNDCTMLLCKELFITEDEWSLHQDRLNEIWPEVDQLWELLK